MCSNIWVKKTDKARNRKTAKDRKTAVDKAKDIKTAIDKAIDRDSILSLISGKRKKMKKCVRRQVKSHIYLHYSNILAPKKSFESLPRMSPEDKLHFIKTQNKRWSNKRRLISLVEPFTSPAPIIGGDNSKKNPPKNKKSEIFSDDNDMDYSFSNNDMLTVKSYCSYCFNNRANKLGWRKIVSQIKLKDNYNGVRLERRACPVCPDEDKYDQLHQPQKKMKKKPLAKKIHKSKFGNENISPLISRKEVACMRLLHHKPDGALSPQYITRVLKKAK